MSYMLEVVVDGKATRISLASMPVSIVARFYSVPDDPAPTLIAEKVLK